MLQQIRDRTTGLIAGFIVALIAIPFAFFGIEQFTGGDSDPVIAKVGDQKIHESQFRRAYEQRYQQLVSLMGENFRADLVDQNRLREAVLRDMTQETVLKQFAESEGFRTDDATLFRAISQDPAFQRDGKFDTTVYRDALNRVGYTTDRYESQLRDTIELNQMRAAVIDTAFTTQTQVLQALHLANQERMLEYAVFDPARYRERVSVSDEDVAAHYEETRSQYQAPERIKLAYVRLSADDATPAEPPGEDVLKVLYDAEKEGRFTTQEERKASHILIGFGADKDQARKKAEDLAAQLKSGTDFAELAKQHSEDPGSKAAGGDLGWVRRGQMVDGFEEALFALEAGQTSEPVETEFGWHLIRLTELKPSVTRSFDDPQVREELTDLFQNRERQQRFEDMADQLEQLAFENPASLEPVAQALGLEVQTTDWFTRQGGAGIAAETAVKTAAFEPEVLQDNENSKPLALSDNRLVVIRKAEYEAPRQKSLEEVAEQIRTQLVDQRARELAAQEAEEVLNAVRDGTAFQEIVSAKNGELRNPGTIRRDNSTVERAVVEAAFGMPRPSGEAPSYAKTALGNGASAVLVLTSVGAPEQAPNEQQQTQLRQRLREQSAGEEFSSYVAAIEDEVGVELLKPVNEPAAAE